MEAGSCEKGHSGPLRQLPERKNLRIVKEIDDRDEKVKFKLCKFGEMFTILTGSHLHGT